MSEVFVMDSINKDSVRNNRYMKKVSNHKYQLFKNNKGILDELPEIRSITLNDYRKLYEDSMCSNESLIGLLREYIHTRKSLNITEKLYINLEGINKMKCICCKHIFQKYDIIYSKKTQKTKTHCVECAIRLNMVTKFHLRDLLIQFSVTKGSHN
jgi:hypothetical protein